MGADHFSVSLDALARLGLAVVLAGLLGWEREWQSKPAGLRTHMIVSLGAASFTLVTLQLYAGLISDPSAATRVDPLRLVEGVIGGIGFLGAGSIIRGRGSVEGLTTAASIWLVGSVGVACGAGQLGLAAVVVGFALAVLVGLGFVERRLRRSVAERAASSGPGPATGAEERERTGIHLRD